MKTNQSLTVLFIVLSALVTGCNSLHMPVSDTKTGAGGGRNAAKGVGYRPDAMQIFEARCKMCHGPGGALPNWMDYETAYQAREKIYQKVVVDKSMPKGLAMSDAERALIGEWVRAGAPETAPGGDDTATPTNPPATEPPANPPANPPVDPTPIPTDLPAGAIGYNQHIKPLFNRLCTMCHNATSPVPNWLDYNVTYEKRDRVLDRVFVKRDMPMAGVMTEAERKLVADWVNAGAPKDAPAGSDPGTPTDPGNPGNPGTPPGTDPDLPPADVKITYELHVKPMVFQPVCSACHNEREKPELNWLNYEIAYAKRDRIFKRAVVAREMPPAHSGLGLTDNQRALVARWYIGGSPR